MGDFGTLFPLAIGCIAVNKIDPAGLFVMMGLTNIALGLVYHLPMPLQPKKMSTNMAVGFAGGLGLGYLVQTLRRRSIIPCLCAEKNGRASDV